MHARTHPSPGAVQVDGTAALATAAVVRRGRGLISALVACSVGVLATLAFAAPERPVALMLTTFVVQAVLCGGLLVTGLARRGSLVLRAVVLGVVAASTGVAAYYFGVHGPLAAALSLLLVILGLAVEPPVQPRWIGVMVYAGIAGSNFVVFALVLLGVLPDVALAPVRLAGHPDWHYVPVHLSLQGLYAAAFIAGGAAARRYHRLVDDIAANTRANDRHDALLDEARADYARAVEIARRGAVAPPGPRQVARAATSDEPISSTLDHGTGGVTIEDPMVVTEAGTSDPDPVAAASLASETNVTPRDDRKLFASTATFERLRASAWDEAFQARMRQQDLAGLVLAGAGAVLLGTTTIDPLPRYVGLVSIAAIVVAFAIRRLQLHRDPQAEAYAPWVVVAVLGVGPMYAWGVNSGVAAIAAVLLFAGGLFRAPRDGAARVLSLLAVIVTQLLLFLLIVGGALSDQGNMPVLIPGEPERAAWLQHAFLQITYLTAYFAGSQVDGRFGVAYRQAEDARHELLRREAMLRDTRAEIDQALRRIGGGLFTGTTVGGYAVGRLLGRGGMGEVYEATDPDGARVALKLLRSERAGDPASLQRFSGEADVLTRIDSPYVARVLEIADGPGALPAIAMEYVEGRSLAELLRDRERLTTAGVASLVRDIARGLQEVHAAGFVHLDVKPSNIVLTEKVEMASRWCLIDFGIARLVARAPTDAIAGTPQYMAPEQALGAAVDARADLFSLCLVVYRALTGRPAFTGADRVALAEAARRGPPDPRAHAAMHDDVALFLRIGLAADPAARWASALELRAAFDRALAGKLSEADRERARALAM